MNKTYLITLGILTILTISAYYPGETYVFENPIGTADLTWTIIENTTPLTIMPIVTYNSTNITVYFPSDMPPSSFIIVFLEQDTKTIVQEVQVNSGGGNRNFGRGTTTIVKNQTQYVEVPNYIPNYIQNETIVYVNQPDWSISENIKKDSYSILFWLLVILHYLIVIVIVIVIAWIVKKIFAKKEISERGYEE